MRERGRRERLGVCAVIVVAALGVAQPATARGTAGEESRFVSLTNGARGRNAQRPYAVAYDLVAVARRHAQRMAARHTIFHNGALTREVSNWQAVGENVGSGHDVESIHQALMNSATHRANILDHDFTQVGVGTTWGDDSRLYVVEVFRQPLQPAPAMPPPVARPRPRRMPPPRSRTRPPPSPDAKVVLVRKLGTAKAVFAKERPSASVDRAFTYVKVMHALA